MQFIKHTPHRKLFKIKIVDLNEIFVPLSKFMYEEPFLKRIVMNFHLNFA